MQRTSFVLGLGLWALVAALACWRLDPSARPITGDNQLYFFLAERAASGVPPHVSLIDTKSQLGVLVTAAGIRAGRALGVDDVAASRAASIAFAAASVVLAGVLAALLTGSTAAGHVAALAMIAARGFTDHAATGSNPKVFLAAFLLVAHVAVAFWRGVSTRSGPRAMPSAAAANGSSGASGEHRSNLAIAVAGVAAGAAFLCWQPALLVVGAVAFEALAGRGGGPRRLAVVLAAALVPVLAYVSYFWLNGALGAQLHQEFAMTLGSVHAPRRFVQSLAFVMTEARGAASPLRVGPLAFVAVSVVVLARLVRRPGWLAAVPGALAFAAGAAAATAFTIYDHQGVPDLFFVAPYFAVSTGVLVAMVGSAVPARLPRHAAAAVLTVVLALQLVRDDALRPARGYTLAGQRGVADDVRRLAGTGSVWVYEAVHLLGLAHLDNHVSYGLFYDDVESVLDVEAWRPERDGRMPAVIVHGRSGIPGSSAWLARGYADETPAAFAAQGLRLWRATGVRSEP